ncbi:MAG: cardiolipin synthase ClsB [Polyangiaceae bacterium]|nr:cardiolipin synthase ClsB [Polyangiaceae bacterium]
MSRGRSPVTAGRRARPQRPLDERLVGGNRATLLRDGREAFPAMLEAIAGARDQVLLEMYWFDSDRVGRRFATALGAAARRGVEVALMYDSFGSAAADRRMFAELEASGARVHEVNPIAPWRDRFELTTLLRRTHRKLLVVDGRAGFTGGINLADQWLPEEDGGDGWRDDAVRIEGPVAAQLVELFARAWERGGRGALRRLPVAAPVGTHQARVLGERWFRSQLSIVRAYVHHIATATRRVWITNSYFLPSSGVLKALTRAAARGVDVRVLLPGTSDVEVVRRAARASYDRLLSGRVRIFEWYGRVLHAKTALVDDDWCTIGSFNLDHLSLRYNLELSLTVADPGFVGELARSFLDDLESSREVRREAHLARSRVERAIDWALYRARSLM